MLGQIEPVIRLPPAPPSATLSLLLAAGTAVATLVTLGWILRSRRRDRAAFDDLAKRYDLEPAGPEAHALVADALGDVFGEGPRVTQLIRHRAHGLNIDIARIVMPLYRVDKGGEWDESLQESQRKLVVIVTGFARDLPDFRLMPNNWALSTVRGKEDNAFQNVMPFGFRNYVLGRDRDRDDMMHLLGGQVQRLLRDNRHLTLDARGRYLAFYLQDNRERPRDLAGFIDRCVEIAEAIDQRTRG